MSKKIRDETIIDALLISATVRSAAAKLGINEQATIMQDKNAPAQTRVSAAAEILRQTIKYTEITDIMQQLDKLEEWRRECEQQH